MSPTDRGHFYDVYDNVGTTGTILQAPQYPYPRLHRYHYSLRCRLAPVPLDGDFFRGEKTASTRGSGGPASLQPSNLNRPHGGEVGFGMAGPESASCRLLFFSGFMAIATASRVLYVLSISQHLSSVSPIWVAGYYPSGYCPPPVDGSKYAGGRRFDRRAVVLVHRGRPNPDPVLI